MSENTNKKTDRKPNCFLNGLFCVFEFDGEFLTGCFFRGFFFFTKANLKDPKRTRKEIEAMSGKDTLKCATCTKCFSVRQGVRVYELPQGGVEKM